MKKALWLLIVVALALMSCKKEDIQEVKEPTVTITHENHDHDEFSRRAYIYRCKVCGTDVWVDEYMGVTNGNFVLRLVNGANNNGGTQPLANTAINLLGDEGNTLTSGVTDNEGKVTLSVPFVLDEVKNPHHYDLEIIHQGTSIIIPKEDYFIHNDEVHITIHQ